MDMSSRARKITPPTLSQFILHRSLLVAELKNALEGANSTTVDSKLVLLCAPAGYGKTTLLADFASHTSLTCCWYFLDSSDADKNVFLRLLLSSIRWNFPQFGASLDQLLDNDLAVEALSGASTHADDTFIEAFIEAIENDITERVAFIFCNYHTVNNHPFISTFIDRFIPLLPKNCVCMIESRVLPKLSLMSLIVHRQVFALGSSKLRFSRQEIHDLAQLQQISPFSEEEVEQLTEYFGGWIAGMLLGTRLGHTQFLALPIPVQPVSHIGPLETGVQQPFLVDYVVQEVFQHEPKIRTFLKETAILQYLLPSVCMKLLEDQQAAYYLSYLERQGIFIVRSDTAHKEEVAYILHPIIGDILRKELFQQAPERFLELHQRAANIFQKRGEYYQAIYHAKQAQEYDLAASFILETSERILATGQIDTLVSWIDSLPEDVVLRHPHLLIIRANMYLKLGEYTSALPLLHTISLLLTQEESQIAADDIPLLQREMFIAKSKALFHLGDYQQARNLSKQVLEQLSIDEVSQRAAAYMRLAVCSNLLGDFTTGVGELQKALQCWGRNTETRETVDLHSALALTYSITGNFALAEHHLSWANRILEQLHDPWCKVDNLIRTGLLKWREGNFTEAETAYKDVLAMTQGLLHFQRGEAYALVNLGKLYQDQDLYAQSLEASEQGLAIAVKLKDMHLLQSALRSLAITYLLMNDVQTAEVFATRIEQMLNENKQDSYDKALLNLVQGTIFLRQNDYEQSCACLLAAEEVLNTTGARIEQLQAMLRAIICYIAVCQTEKGDQLLKKVTDIVTRFPYEHIVLLEFRRFPVLASYIQSSPRFASLCTLLGIQQVSQEKSFPQISSRFDSGERQMPLKIYALGEPALFLGNEAVTRWRMPRSMELFFLFLDSGSPLRKEQIITALWPEIDEQTDQNWRSTLFYLRKVIGETCIIKSGSRYELKLANLYGKNIWHDAALFLQHKEQAEQALVVDDTRLAHEMFLKMVDLYRGDYLQSFYSDWCIRRRDTLRQEYLNARHQLALLAWNNEDFDECVLHWQHTLAIDNCLEESHYGLMRCYVRQNRRSLALRQYQRCAKNLSEELGITPNKGTQKLYQEILQQP